MFFSNAANNDKLDYPVYRSKDRILCKNNTDTNKRLFKSIYRATPRPIPRKASHIPVSTTRLEAAAPCDELEVADSPDRLFDGFSSDVESLCSVSACDSSELLTRPVGVERAALELAMLLMLSITVDDAPVLPVAVVLGA